MNSYLWCTVFASAQWIGLTASAFFLGCAFMSWVLLTREASPMRRATDAYFAAMRLHFEVGAASIKCSYALRRMRQGELAAAAEVEALDVELTKLKLEFTKLEAQANAAKPFGR